MTLLRLIRSFGLRRGLALWLLPDIKSTLDNEYQPKAKIWYYDSSSESPTYAVTNTPKASVTIQ